MTSTHKPFVVEIKNRRSLPRPEDSIWRGTELARAKSVAPTSEEPKKAEDQAGENAERHPRRCCMDTCKILI
jgi:hypothetical protein